jgi:hypothetical protein
VRVETGKIWFTMGRALVDEEVTCAVRRHRRF